jgi:hypothetical protein
LDVNHLAFAYNLSPIGKDIDKMLPYRAVFQNLKHRQNLIKKLKVIHSTKALLFVVLLLHSIDQFLLFCIEYIFDIFDKAITTIIY